MSHKKSLLHQSCSSSLPITSTVCQSAQHCCNTPVLQYCQVIKVCSSLLLLVSCPSISCSLPHSCSFKPLLLILFTASLLLIKLCLLFVSHSQSCCPMSLSTVLFSSCSYQLSNCLLYQDISCLFHKDFASKSLHFTRSLLLFSNEVFFSWTKIVLSKPGKILH